MQNVSALQSRMARTLGEPPGMALCRQMALPGEQKPPIRLPTQSMEKTAVAAFIYNERVSFPGTMPTSAAPYDTSALQGFTAQVEIADFAILLYGQPGRTYICGPIVGEEGTYNFTFSPGVNAYRLVGGNLANTSYEANEFLPLSSLTLASGTPFLGPKITPVGISQGRRFQFMTAGVQLKIAQGHSAPSAYTFTVFLHSDANSHDRLAVVTVPSAAPVDHVLFTVPENGYYAFQINSWTPTDTLKDLVIAWKAVKSNANVQYGWHINVLRDVHGAEYSNADAGIGEHMRRTGCALLTTNTSNIYNKQGECVAARVPNSRFAEYRPELLATAVEPYYGLAGKGSYTYMDFTTADEEFRDVTQRSANTSQWELTYSLDDVALVHMVTMQGIYTRTTLQLKLHMSVEWRNTTQRYVLAAPAGSPLDLLEARRINNSTDYFYENPIHIQDVMRWIRKGWSTARRYAIPISRGVAAAFPETAGIALPLGRALAT